MKPIYKVELYEGAFTKEFHKPRLYYRKSAAVAYARRALLEGCDEGQVILTSCDDPTEYFYTYDGVTIVHEVQQEDA